MTVVWTRRAARHLDREHAFIAKDNTAAAAHPASRIVAAVERLAEYPESGRRGRVPGTRELVVPGLPYIVAYRVRDHAVQIVAVLHAARKWPGGFEP